MNYRAIDNSASLQHWKYIKRYRSGGKWRYVYADKKTHKSIDSKLKTAITNEDRSHQYNKTLNRVTFNITDVKEDKEKNTRQNKEIRRLINDSNKYKSIADENYKMRDEEISRNSVSTLAKEKINKGKNFISKLLKR